MNITHEQAKNFIRDILKVYRDHNLSLGHEDHHGAFIIEQYDPINVEWLQEAFYNDNKHIKW